MAIRDFIKEIGLDPGLIERDREMSAGLGRAHEAKVREFSDGDADGWFVHGMAAATEYRRAGAHSVLLSDLKTAREMFRQAAQMYGRLRRPYAVMMYSCADGELSSIMAMAHDFGAANGIERTQLGYLLLASAAGQEERDLEALETFRENMETARNAPVGVLGIPVGAYLDLAAALEQEKPAQRQMVEVLLPFLIPYSTAIRRCMEDEFHWERLAFPFHPAEPDVLGVLFCVEASLRAREQESLLGMIRELPLSKFATEILYNAILERFGDGTVGGGKPEGGKPQLRFR